MTIACHDINLTLGKAQVLSCCDTVLERGKVTAILGPNGAGKTSLLKVMAGLISPDSGQALLDGQAVISMDRLCRARQLGYLAQETAPAWDMKVCDLVALGRLSHVKNFHQDQQLVEQSLHMTGASHLASRPVRSLSGGERARVLFARLLAGEPDWILADEPLANLDPPYQRDLLALLRAEAESGKGVAVILHSLDAAMLAADAVILMRAGRIVVQGATNDVMTPLNLATTYGMEFAIGEVAGRRAVVPLG